MIGILFNTEVIISDPARLKKQRDKNDKPMVFLEQLKDYCWFLFDIINQNHLNNKQNIHPLSKIPTYISKKDLTMANSTTNIKVAVVTLFKFTSHLL